MKALTRRTIVIDAEDRIEGELYLYAEPASIIAPDEHKNFFRGVLFAVLLSAPVWIAVIYAVRHFTR